MMMMIDDDDDDDDNDDYYCRFCIYMRCNHDLVITSPKASR